MFLFLLTSGCKESSIVACKQPLQSTPAPSQLVELFWVRGHRKKEIKANISLEE
jgi:hypothetical protein